MFLKFNKRIDTIFLDKSSENFIIEDSVNIILSPSLYWVKKVSLPVKYVREVKPLLASLFEDILPEGIYSYSAYKKGDDFFIFAYEDKMILDLLITKGISQSQVKNVHFAQNELVQINDAIKINESESIYFKEEILVVVPSSWLKESVDLDINILTLSTNYIKLKQFGHLVNDKSFYIIASAISFLIILIGMEYFITLTKIDNITESRTKLFAKDGLKPTMFQNRAMLDEYKIKYSAQMKLRKYISYLLSMNLSSKHKISLLSLKHERLIVEYSGIKQGQESKIEKVFKDKKLKYIANFRKNSWHVEIKL